MEQPQGVRRAVPDVRVAADRRHGQQVDLRARHREPDREGVVEAGVAVDDQGQRLLGGSERRRPGDGGRGEEGRCGAWPRPADPARRSALALLVRLAGGGRPADASHDARHDDDRDDVRDAVEELRRDLRRRPPTSSVWDAPANPKTSAAPNAPTGCHAPKIMAASAMKPLPAVCSIRKRPAVRATGTSRRARDEAREQQRPVADRDDVDSDRPGRRGLLAGRPQAKAPARPEEHVREDDDHDVPTYTYGRDEKNIGPRTGMSERNGSSIAATRRRLVELGVPAEDPQEDEVRDPDGADVDDRAGDDLVDLVADPEPGEEEAEEPGDAVIATTMPTSMPRDRCPVMIRVTLEPTDATQRADEHLALERDVEASRSAPRGSRPSRPA